MNQPVKYPQFRKYINDMAYFKIVSESEWEEIQVMGKRYSIHSFMAKILPDRNFIYDLTYDYKRNWLKIEEEEYERIKSNVI